MALVSALTCSWRLVCGRRRLQRVELLPLTQLSGRLALLGLLPCSNDRVANLYIDKDQQRKQSPSAPAGPAWRSGKHSCGDATHLQRTMRCDVMPAGLPVKRSDAGPKAHHAIQLRGAGRRSAMGLWYHKRAVCESPPGL